MATSNDITEPELKSYISSILTSSPHISTIQTVERDYREFIGIRMPFHKFGYNSVEHFLKSIPDVCKVNGIGSFAQVTPVINKKIEHINEMVTQQKVNVKGRRKAMYPRRSRGIPQNISTNFRKQLPPRGQTYNYAFSPNTSSYYSSASLESDDGYSFNHIKPNALPNNVLMQMPNAKSLNMNSVIPTQNSSSACRNPVNIKSNNNFHDQNVNKANVVGPTVTKRREQLQNVPQPQMQDGILCKTPITSTPLLQETKGTALPEANASHILPCNAPVLDDGDEHNFALTKLNNSRDKDPKSSEGQEEVSFQKSIEKFDSLLHFENVVELEEDTSNVPKRVQSNLRALISQFVDGIWCCDLPGHYKKLFRKDLIYYDYGYTSLIEMCMALKHIFHYVRPGKDDFKLYDRSKPLPPNVEKLYTMASYDIGEKASGTNALPELEWSDFDGTLPADIFKYGEEIPKQFLPEGTRTEEVFDVVVVEMYDPSKFWFYVGKSDRESPLDKLMDDMQNFYSQPENIKEYGVPSGVVREGLYCVQVIYGEYHRAKVIRLLPDSTEYVRLLYIDYGTSCKAPVKGMCFLHSKFSSLPAQAIRCRLANIVPNLKGHPWPRSTTTRFRELINGRDSKIKISYINWDEEYVCVFLADVTDMNNIVYINEVLVKEGHAVWDGEAQANPLVLSNFKCKVQNLHFFPTFLELEYGLAPNSSEMHSLEEMLVPIQFCIPQYFEPNEDVYASNEENIEHMENCFIDTVKNHRKVTPLNMVDVGAVMHPPSIDFDIFGELKGKIQEFCGNLNLENGKGEPLQQKREELICEIEKSQRFSLDGYAPACTLKQNKELSENIFKELKKYSILGDQHSTGSESSNRNSDNQDQFQETIDLDLCDEGTYSSAIIEHELSTILEQSESPEDYSSNILDYGLENVQNESVINRLDRLGHFEENLSSSAENVTAESFLRNVEKLSRRMLESESDSCLGSCDTTENSSNVNLNSENPFIVNLDGLGDLLDPEVDFKSFIEMRKLQQNVYVKDDNSDQIDSCNSHSSEEAVNSENEYASVSFLTYTTKQFLIENFLDNIREKKEMKLKKEEGRNLRGCERDIDLPESNLEKTKSFISSLSLNNPFRSDLEKTLEDDNDSLSTLSSKVEQSVKSSHHSTDILNAKVPNSSLNLNQELLKPVSALTQALKSKGSDTDNPRNVSCQVNNYVNLSNTMSWVQSQIPPGVCTPPRISTPPAACIPPRVFTPPGKYVPAECPPYPQWSNGGGYPPLPQYSQWSNGGGLPAPYQNYPQPRDLRPPPGFAPIQGPAQCFPSNYNPNFINFNSRIMTNMPGIPLYYGSTGQMAHPAHMVFHAPNISKPPDDFYERYNAELLKNMK